MSLYTWLRGEDYCTRNPPPIQRPTIIYNVTIQGNDNIPKNIEQVIRQYIISLLDEKTIDYADIIYNRVMEQVNNSLENLDIESIIKNIFDEIPIDQIDAYFNE